MILIKAKNTFNWSFILLGLLIFAALLLPIFYFANFQKQINLGFLSGKNFTAKNSNVGVPVRVMIPSIGVNALVEQKGLAKDGSVGVPSGPYDTAWYNLGARPGEQGSAVITGHYGPWKNGAKSVFDNLGNLKSGDKIYVVDDKGIVNSFVVTSSHVYPSNASAPEVFNKNDGVYLNLITCHGEWLKNQKTYTDRLVIFTQKI